MVIKKRNCSYVFAAVLGHGLAELDCACYVVVIIDHRLFHRFVDVFTASEMDNSIESAGKKKRGETNIISHQRAVDLLAREDCFV